ncbi:MAG: FkbM family methyltransferase [Bryobacterales bacterium]|nr:FkbM family methyltransferase [Bryobacterales bacterium]
MKLRYVFVLLVALFAFVWFYPPARLRAIFLLGKSPVCPYARAIEVTDHQRELMQAKDRILNASRLIGKDGHFHHWQTPMGSYWIPRGDDYVLPFNLAEEDRKIYGTAPHFVRQGDVVLDCGANVGVFTRQALDAGARLVVAIEPAPENLECLRRNFAPEVTAGRVIIYPKGVWDKDDVLTLNVDPSNTAADSFVIRRQGAVTVAEVPLTTIDKLGAELKLDRVDFIKMDIEGAEPKALAGARDTLTRFKPRMSISAYHQPSDPVTIPATIRSIRADYKMECGPCAEAGFYIRPDILYFE